MAGAGTCVKMPARGAPAPIEIQMLKPVRLTGHVVRKRINVGSKSDQEAAVLVCARGEFKLRRRGGPPFVDAALDALVGKRIRASGVVSAGQFIVDEVEVTGNA